MASKQGILFNKRKETGTYGGRYIHKYVSPNLKWFERAGLMTCINQLKYQNFRENEEGWLRNHKVVNIYIIHDQCSWKKLENLIKYHKTIYNDDFKLYLAKEKQEAISYARRVKRDDFF